MGLLGDFMLDNLFLGGCFKVKCPKCGHTNRVYKGDIICWSSYRQYAKHCKQSSGSYPKCHECGAEMDGKGFLSNLF